MLIKPTATLHEFDNCQVGEPVVLQKALQALAGALAELAFAQLEQLIGFHLRHQLLIEVLEDAMAQQGIEAAKGPVAEVAYKWRGLQALSSYGKCDKNKSVPTSQYQSCGSGSSI
jgi:hypothetical protein